MPSAHHSPSKPPASGPARGGALEADSRRMASTRSPQLGNPKDERARHHQSAPHPPNGIKASENRDAPSSHRHVAKELQGARQTSKAPSRPPVTVRCTTTPIDAPYAKTYTSGLGAGMRAGPSSTRMAMSGQFTDKAFTSTLPTTAPGTSHGSRGDHLYDSKRPPHKHGDSTGVSIRSTITPVTPVGTSPKPHAPRMTPSPSLHRTVVADPSASTTTSTPKASPSGTSKSRPPDVPPAAEQSRPRVQTTAPPAHKPARIGEEDFKHCVVQVGNLMDKVDTIRKERQHYKPFTREDAARSGAVKAKLKAEAEAAAATKQPPATSRSSPAEAAPLVHAKSPMALVETSPQAADTNTQPPRTTPRPIRETNAPPRVGGLLPSDARTAAQSTDAAKHAPAAAHSPPRALSDAGSSSVSQSSSQVTITPAREAKRRQKSLDAAAELAGRANIQTWRDSIPENARSPSAPPSSVAEMATNALSDISKHSDQSMQIRAASKAPPTSAQSTRAPVAAAVGKPTTTTEPRLSHAPVPVTAPAASTRRAATTPAPAPKAVPHPVVRTNPPTALAPRLKTVGTQTTPHERPPLPPTRSTRDIATSTASAPPSPRSPKGGDLPPSRHVPSEATKRSPQIRRILPSTSSEAMSTNSVSSKSTTHATKSDEARVQRTVSSGSNASRSSMPTFQIAPAKQPMRTSSSGDDPTIGLPPPPSTPLPALLTPPSARTSKQPSPPDTASIRTASSAGSSETIRPSKPTTQTSGRSSPPLTHRKIANDGVERKTGPRHNVETTAGGSVAKAWSPNAATPQLRRAPTPKYRSALAPNTESAAMPPSLMDDDCSPATPHIQASNTEVSSKAGKASSSNDVRPSAADAASASTGMPVKEIAKHQARLSKADTVVSEVASVYVVPPPLPPLPPLPVSRKLSPSCTRVATPSAKGKERARDLSPERSSAVPSEGLSIAGAETSRLDSPPQPALSQSSAALSFGDPSNWSESPKLTTAFERGVEDSDDDDNDNDDDDDNDNDDDNDDDYNGLVYQSLPTYLTPGAPTRPLPPAPLRTSSDFAADSLKNLEKSTAQLDWQHNVALRRPESRPRPLKSAMKPRPQVVSSPLGEPYDLVDATGASSSRAVRFNAASPSGSSSSSSTPVQQDGESPSPVPSSLCIEEPNDESPPRYSSLSLLRAPTRGPLAAVAAAVTPSQRERSQSDATEQRHSQLRHTRSVPGPFLLRNPSKLQQLREKQRSGGLYTNVFGSRSAASLRNPVSHLGQPLAATEVPQAGPSTASKLWQKAKNGFGLGGKKEQPPQVQWVVPVVKTVPPELEVRPEWPREKAPSLLKPKS